VQKLIFEDDDTGRQRYEILFQSVALSQKQCQVSDWDDVVGLVKKLKSIGNPAKERIGTHVLYDLQDGGGEIVLERSEAKLLLEFVSQPIWRPLAIPDALAVRKWLENIPKVSGSLNPDAPPHVQRRAAELVKE
jgi:hypothetical protein